MSRRPPAVLAAAVAPVALLAAGARGQIPADWIGPAAGDWSVDAHWSSATFPNAADVDASIAGNFDVTIGPGLARTVGTLELTAPADLTVSTGSTLNVANASLDNAGRIALDAATLSFLNNATITGGGRIDLDGATIAGNANRTVTHADNLIVGSGNLGGNLIAFANAGTVRASGGTLTLDPRNITGGFEFLNTGTLEAGAGGTLVLTGNAAGEFDNAGGLIRADGGGVRLVADAFVSGGSYATGAGGVVEVASGQNGFLYGFTNAGQMVGRDGSDFGVRDAIANSGDLRIESTGTATDLEIQGATTIGGNGTITLVGPLAGINGAANQTLTIGTGQAVRGEGRVGQNAIALVNNGLFTSDAGGTMTIDPRDISGGREFDNNGTLRAQNASTLLLTGSSGGEYDNTGGLIEATGAASVVRLVSFANVAGGTLRGTGGGVVEVGEDQNAFFFDATFSGQIASRNNSDFGIGNAATNNGTLTIQAGDDATDLEIQNSTLLDGTGTVVLSGPLAGVNGALNTFLTVGEGQTIRGEGRLGQNAIGVVNRGTIRGDVAGGVLTIDPRDISGDFEFFNTGLVRAQGGGTVRLTGSFAGQFTNVVGTDAGVMEAVGAGSELQLTTDAFIADGTLRGTGGGVVRQLAGTNVFLRDLTLGGPVVVEDNSDFGIAGTITNSGTITLAAGGSATDLEVQSGGATLAGNGSVVLSGANAGINGALNQTLTIGSGQTVRGEGRVGQNAIAITNNGTIAADVAGGTLLVDPRDISGGREFDNNGRLRAIGGGELVLTGNFGGEFDNSGGVIEAVGTGAAVRLTTFANLAGGTLRGVGGGTVEVGTGENVFVGDLTIDGVLNVAGNSDFGIFGTVVNDGTITLDGTGAANDLEIQGNATFAGSGDLVLVGPNAGVNGTLNATLLNDSGNTIRGQGRVGQNAIAITNDGFIVADVDGQELVLDPRDISGAAEFVNNGTLLAIDGGILVLDGAFGGEFLNNNEVTVANGGQILFRNGANLTNANPAGSDRLIGGTFRAFDDGTGTTFNIVPPNFDLEVNEGATVEIQGPLVSSNLFDDAASSPGDLVGFKFRQNGGTFIIGGGTDLTIDLPAAGPNELVNTGTFLVESGSTFDLTGGTVVNTGVLGGGGAFVGNVDTTAGTLAAGDRDAAGTFTQSGGDFLADGARLEIDLYGLSDFDRVVAAGTLAVDGATIFVDLEGGFLPEPNDRFTVVLADVIDGSLGVANDTGLPGLGFFIDQTPTAAAIAVEALLLGDANYDGAVNLSDFTILANNFGDPATYTGGDFDQSGTVNLSDFTILANNFGRTLAADIPPPAAGDEAVIWAWHASVVPEPAAAAALLLPAMLLIRRRAVCSRA